jgi:hypothetical protein
VNTPACYSTPKLIAASKGTLTYRQVDYWTRVGYLKPVQPGPGGTGVPRRWPVSECRIALLMGRLVAAGFTHEAAHKVARAEGGVCELAPGIHVTLRSRRTGQVAQS